MSQKQSYLQPCAKELIIKQEMGLCASFDSVNGTETIPEDEDLF